MKDAQLGRRLIYGSVYSHKCSPPDRIAKQKADFAMLINKIGAHIFSIKHDLARSCFQLWPKIGDEGDKISREKTGEALAETVFSWNFVTLGADFESQN